MSPARIRRRPTAPGYLTRRAKTVPLSRIYDRKALHSELLAKDWDFSSASTGRVIQFGQWRDAYTNVSGPLGPFFCDFEGSVPASYVDEVRIFVAGPFVDELRVGKASTRARKTAWIHDSVIIPDLCCEQSTDPLSEQDLGERLPLLHSQELGIKDSRALYEYLKKFVSIVYDSITMELQLTYC